MSSRPPILIAGAGIAGLSLALALSRKGLPSRILERRSQPAEAGAGIQLGPNAMGVLGRLGISEAIEQFAGRPEAIEVADGMSGRRLAVLPLGRSIAQRFGTPYRVMRRADLHTALMAACRTEGLEITSGFEVADWDDGEGRIEVASSSGATATGAALVGADGLWSAVRRKLAPGGALIYSGKMAARTVIAAEAAGSRFARDVTGVWVARDAHVVHYPVRAGREIAVVVIVDEARPREGWGGEIDTEAVLSRVAHFAPELVAFLRAGRDWRSWSLYDPIPLRTWTRGRVVLTGDAAHPILPFLAQGGALAIEDAETLASLIALVPESPSAAFPRFERLRRPRTIRVQTASRDNGVVFHLGGPLALARNLTLATVPGPILMRRYDWLYGWRGDGR